jgi:hypothetical protein
MDSPIQIDLVTQASFNTNNNLQNKKHTRRHKIWKESMELPIERITGSKIWKKIGIPETS